MKLNRLINGLLWQRSRAVLRWRRPLATLALFVLIASGFALVRASAGERFAWQWPESLSRIFGTRSAMPLTPPVSGTKTICPSGCDYATLTAAISDINTNGGATGAIVLELGSTYVSTSETFPINPKITGASISNTITIRPATGATNLLIQTSGTQAFNLDGATFITIDGRPGGTGTAKQLTIDNTSTTGQAIQFINDATANTVEYCIVKGAHIGTSSGVIVFSTTTGTTGNDNNTIDNCDVRDSTTTPINGIYAAGTTSSGVLNNSGITISNNNIFNFYGGTSNGISITNGNNTWTISGNSFYQTSSRIGSAGTTIGINIFVTTPADNSWTVTGNFIGGDSPNAAVTTQKWTISGNAALYRFVGIQLNVGTTTASSVQNNTIANFTWLTSSTFSAGSGIWSGIYVNAGRVNVGTTTGNVIGASSGTGSISANTTGNGGASFGIAATSTSTVAISNNTIGSITVTGSSTSVSHSFAGIQVTSGTNTISGNTVGSTSTSNSINASTSSTSATGQAVTGILSSSSTSASIASNTIANLNNAYAGTATTGSTRGIAVTNGTNTITGNTIRNIAGVSQNGGISGTSGPTVGISVDITAVSGQTVSQNVVHSLTANYFFSGIFCNCSGSTTNLFSRNFVHSLNIPSPSAGLSIFGIRINGGTATLQNNFIRLGIDATGNSITYPLYLYGIHKGGGPGSNVYFNTVLIAGTGVSSVATSDTNAFTRQGAPSSGTDDIRNNIFVNTRSNASGTNKHYAYTMFTSAASVLSDYNLYYVGGTGGVLGNIAGSDRTTLANIQTATGGDPNSITSDPLFINPNGTFSNVDLHVSNTSPAGNEGIQIAGVSNDFDNETRNNPPDIGADEFTPAPAGTSTTVLADDTSVAAADLVTFTATVTSGTAGTITGTVQIKAGGNDVGSPALLSGSAPFQAFPATRCITVGTHTITAVYSGDANYATSTGTQLESQSVVKPSSVVVDDSFTGSDCTGLGASALVSAGQLILGRNAFSTVAAGQAGVASGGTLHLAAGTYAENITVGVGELLTLTGDVVLDGSLTLNGTLNVGTHTVTLNGAVSGNGTLNSDATGTVDYNQSANGQNVLAGSYGNLTFNSFNKILASSGIIGIAGTFTPGPATGHTINGSTVQYNGATAQTLPSGFLTYNNLTLNNGAGTTAPTGLVVNGILEVQSGTFSSHSDYHDVLIDVAGTLSLAADITVSGNWTNNGTFTHNGFGVTFDGTGAQTITTGGMFAGKRFAQFAVNKSAGTATLAGDLGTDSLVVTAGTFDQGASFRVDTSGAGTVATVGASGTWQNFGTGDLELSGNVTNSGLINFNGNGTACNEPPATDDIFMFSSGDARTWSGSGTFSMTDVTVFNQQVPQLPDLPPPVFILVNSGTNVAGNTGWQFVNQCTAGTYTWVGGTAGVNTDWQVATNWNPARVTPAAGDILIFDGTSTPAPTVTNVPTQAISSLRLKNGANPVTLNASAVGAPHTLTITGNAGLDIPATNLLTVGGANGLTVAVTTGSASTIGGQIILQGGAHALTGANAGQILFANGSIFTTSTGFAGHPFGTGTNGSVIFQSGASAFFNAGSGPFGGSGNTIVTFNLGSNQQFGASSAWSAHGRSYGNLTLAGTSQTYFDSSASIQVTVLGNLTIGSTNTLQLSGTAGGDLNLLGNFTDNGTFTHNNRTVKFQGGNATQTVSKSNGTQVMFDVLIAKTAGPNSKVSLGGNTLTINGALQFTSIDDVLELGGASLVLNGTVSGAGGIRGDLLGSAIQVGGTGALGTLRFVSGGEILHNLTVNRTSSGSVDLGSSLTIGDGSLGGLNLTNGVINTGAHTLIHNAPGLSRTNGYVIGNLQKNFAAIGSYTFHVGTANGYSPVGVNVTGNTFPASLTVKAVQGPHPNITGANALQRYWTLTETGDLQADVTFNWRGGAPASGDVVGTESLYKIFKYNGSFTQFEPSSPIDTVDHKATLNGVSDFSDWTLAEASALMPGSLQFSSATYGGAENDGPITVTVTRTGGTAGSVSVDYATVAGGTATSGGGTCGAGVDYQTTSGMLTWLATDSSSKSFTVSPCPDSVPEPDETVNLQLSNAQGGATLGAQSTATLTITTDDPCPTAFAVNDNGDASDANPGDGVCATSGAVCTLRAAIQEANALTSCGTITIDATGVTGQINLDSELPAIDHDVNITGPGAATLTVQRSTAPATPEFRIFTTGTPRTVAISDLKISNGRITAPGSSVSAGGIFNPGGSVMTLTGVTVAGNSVAASVAQGGGISNIGTLTIINSTISGNSATTPSGSNVARGGGIFNGGSLTITNTTISGSSLGDYRSRGGGIYNHTTGTASLTNCTVSNNSTSNISFDGTSVSDGGGINNFGTFTITNTTISGNSASGGINALGGGIRNSATLTITNSTISGNSADISGGGIINFGTTNLRNSIIALNNATTGPDIEGSVTSQGHNVVGDTSGATITATTGDKFNAAASPLNLGPLQNNGGPTETRALGSGSVAIDAGDDCVFDDTCSPALGVPLTTDQRGAGFSRQVDGNSDGTAVVDIGAYEAPTCTTSPATPTASNGGPYSIGQTIQLNTPTVAGATYAWIGPSSFTSSLQNPTRANAATAHAGTYSVTVTLNGCTSAVGTTNVVVVADTDVAVSSGNLVISDANGDNTNDTLTLSRLTSPDRIRINDPNNTLNCGAGMTTVDTHTCEVALGDVTGNIQVNTLGGNDTLTLDLGSGDFIPGGGLSYAGGDPTTGPGDKLIITGGTQGKVTYNYTNAHDGSIVMEHFGTVNYTGLEPIGNSGTATDVEFNLPAGPANAATLSDLGGGMSRLASGAPTFELTDFANPSGSVKINRGNAGDTMMVNALAANYPSLTIGSAGSEFSTITFNGAVLLAANKNLAGYALYTISLPNAGSDLAASGNGTISLTTAADISLLSGSSITVVDGALTLNANQQGSPTSGEFVGITLNGATIQATGTGVVTAKGRGGTGSPFNASGVLIDQTSIVRGGSSAGITTDVVGTAGASNSTVAGVTVRGTITSLGGHVRVIGFGGSDGGKSGVLLQATGAISSGDNGNVTVEGTGGTSAFASFGIRLDSNSTITSGGSGTVNVTGTGGSAGGFNSGVLVNSTGSITSGGSGAVSVTGTGGAGPLSHGVEVGLNGLITSGGGAVSVTGTGGGDSGHGTFLTTTNASSSPTITSGGGTVTVTGTPAGTGTGIVLDAAAGGTSTISSGSGATINLVADSIAINANTTVNAAAGIVNIRPNTNGTFIDLGGADVAGAPATLGLTDAELDRVTCGTLNIGDDNSESITVTADITRTASTNMLLHAGCDIVISGGQVNTQGGTLKLDSGPSPDAVKPTQAGTDVTASTLSFGSDLAIVINGVTVDTEYTQLNVLGDVDLTSVDLALSGTHTPANGDIFTIVNNAGSNPITGKFNLVAGPFGTDANGGLLEEGDTITNFLGSSASATITYAGGIGTGNNDVLLTVTTCPTITLSPASLPDGAIGHTYPTNITASGGVAAYTFAMAGSVPGLTLNSDGTWSGTATTLGSFNFAVTATDANGCTGTQAYTLVIKTCPPQPFTVNSLDDNDDADLNDNLCQDSGGNCTLRAAIQQANATPAACGTLNIDFTVNGAIELSSPLDAIQHDVNINGPGMDVLYIDGLGNSRIFQVDQGYSVSISGLAMFGGDAGSGDGGGILNLGTLTLTNSTVAFNFAERGGGIENDGTLTVTGSIIAENYASRAGGGIRNLGTMTMANTFVLLNFADRNGGGIHNDWSDDTADPIALIVNSTIIDNVADADDNGSGDGGGVFNNNGYVRLVNTIVAYNILGFAGDDDVCGPTDVDVPNSSHNIIGSVVAGGLNDGDNGNQVGVDPLLDLDGAPLSGSPAIDKGDDCVLTDCTPTIVFSVDIDQRGTSRPQGTHVDIGAIEVLQAVVNTTAADDDGACDALVPGSKDCTLREAINFSNANPGTLIVFGIPNTDSGCDSGSGVCTISPTTNLPAITEQVSIDGYTQQPCPPSPTGPCSRPNTLSLDAGDDASLLIVLNGANVSSNGRGLDLEQGSDQSTIRGLVINQWNTAGIYINNSGGNTVEGNFIGTDAAGTSAAGAPGGAGVLIVGDCTVGAIDNIIGGDLPRNRNLISGNGDAGINIGGNSGACVDGTIVEGNYIGTDRNGLAAIPNAQSGVIIQAGSYFTTVGCEVLDGDNLISGNTGAGIKILGSNENVIIGNFIGTDRNGTAPLGNARGILIQNSQLNVVGVIPFFDVFPNVVSANTGDGIAILGASNNLLQGNYIGTDKNGAVVPGMGNGGNGVEVYLNSSNNTIGGPFPDIGTRAAKQLEKASPTAQATNKTRSAVQAQDRTRLAARALNKNGRSTSERLAKVRSRRETLLKRRGSAAKRQSSRTAWSKGSQTTADSNSITLLCGCTSTQNTIAGNGEDGVRVSSNGDFGNLISENSIFSNTGLGINLGTDGVTLNNTADHLNGPNHYQNYPVINFANPGDQNLNFSIDGTGGTAPFTIEFFVNNACDGTNGEGKKFIGSTTVNSGGPYTFVPPIPFANGEIITATATDGGGNTSEFSVCKLAGPPAISIDSVNLSEGHSGTSDLTFNVTLSSPTSQVVTVQYATQDGTTNPATGGTCGTVGVDYATGSGTVTFNPGETTMPVTISVCGDTFIESDETFFVNLSSPVNATIANGQGTGTINNDDCPGPLLVDYAGDTHDANPGDGNCADSLQRCSLRAAVEEANAYIHCPATIDINFGFSTETIIALGVLGQLSVEHNVNINGPTTYPLIISGNGQHRAFQINSGKIVSISNLSIIDGIEASGDGGGILNHGTLTLKGVTVNGNTAVNGGGLATSPTSNSLTLINTTISGNTSTGNGGGLYNATGLAALTNVTIAYNTANSDGAGSELGGGIFVTSGDVTLHNTIVTDNLKGLTPSTTADDVSGVNLNAASSYNLIGTGSGGLLNGGNNNQVGVATALLKPLQDNGGATRTHALTYKSPAVDQGDGCVVSGCGGNSPIVDTDQRGKPRTPLNDGDDSGASGVDIGAYERQVTETRDVAPGDPSTVDVVDAIITLPCVQPCGGSRVNPDSTKSASAMAPSVALPAVSLAAIDPAQLDTLTRPPNTVIGNTSNPPLPAFEVTTTATYTPPATVCFYLPAITSPATFGGLKVLHREAGPNMTYGDSDDLMVDRTRSTNPTDFANKLVCAEVDSFSAFAIAQTVFVTPTAENATVSGHTLDNQGNPVEGAAVRMNGTQNRLTITDAEGKYHFDDVETNGFYVITPSRANFTFSPAQRNFSQLGANTEATFTGAASGGGLNPLDVTEYFVRQQYLDFLGREPDNSGFNFWVNNIESCGNDIGCREAKRVDTSAAFFLSIESRQTGYLIYRFYQAAYGEIPTAPVPLRLSEYTSDAAQISKGVVVLQNGWQRTLENNTRAFAEDFVKRGRFGAAYPVTMTPVEFVGKLFANGQIPVSDADHAAAIAEFGGAPDTSDVSARARALRRIAENSVLARRHFNRAFVLMEYFGYLRRDPNSGPDRDFSGFNFWLDKLDRFDGNFRDAEMVKAFLTSIEYRARIPR